MFVPDIAAAGADGFIFEPMLPLDAVVQRFGNTHVIIGSKVDCLTLTFGKKDAIRREIDLTLQLARNCPGFVFAVGNHIPSNVPLENALFYMDYLRQNWTRAL
jgi:uroporphyrinogen-III decarboxylase